MEDNKKLVALKLKRNLLLAYPTASYISNLFLEGGGKNQRACSAIEETIEYRMHQLKDETQSLVIKVSTTSETFDVSIFDMGLPYSILGKRKDFLDYCNVDSYKVHHLGKKGQEITLSFKYDNSDDPFKAPEIDNTEKLLDDNFNCRLLKAEEKDMLEAIRCLYTAYGYDYVHQDLYHFSSFKRKLESGEYWAVVCENDHHQIVAHCALDNESLLEGMPEICCLVTRPFVRGHGLAEKLFNYTEQLALDKGFDGIFLCPVLHHPFSQRIISNAGCVPVAMNLSMAPPITKDGLSQHEQLRICVGMAVKFINNKHHSIYVPDIYEEYASWAYGEVGLDFDIITSSTQPIADTSIYSIEFNNSLQTATIRVDEAGKDIDMILSKLMQDDVWHTIEMGGLYINISNPSALGLYDVFKKHGFIFAGVIPGSKTGDYIYMQWLKTPFPQDMLQLEPNYKTMMDKLKTINQIS